MTTICALRDGPRTLLGSDSRVSYGSHVDSCDDKLFTVCGVGCGAAGDALLIQYVRHGLKGTIGKQSSLVEFATRTLAPKIQRITRELAEFEEDIYSEFIFARGAELLSISSRGEVSVSDREYLAIGTGATFAMGALRNSRGKAEDRMVQAINTACEFDESSCGPVRMVWV